MGKKGYKVGGLKVNKNRVLKNTKTNLNVTFSFAQTKNAQVLIPCWAF